MLTEIEFAILDAIQGIRSGLLDRLMVEITTLGNGGIVWIAAGVAMLFSRKYRRVGVAVLIAASLSGIIGNLVIKNIVARPRPCVINSAIELLIALPRGYSFPSGHTLCSFSAAVSMLLYNKKMGVCALTLASLIGFSRMYLYVHFLSDVLAGILLGILLARLAVWISKKPKWHWLG